MAGLYEQWYVPLDSVQIWNYKTRPNPESQRADVSSGPSSSYCGKQLAVGVLVAVGTLTSWKLFGGPTLSAVWLRSISAPCPVIHPHQQVPGATPCRVSVTPPKLPKLNIELNQRNVTFGLCR
jgi:hypothetical protein